MTFSDARVAKVLEDCLEVVQETADVADQQLRFYEAAEGNYDAEATARWRKRAFDLGRLAARVQEVLDASK